MNKLIDYLRAVGDLLMPRACVVCGAPLGIHERHLCLPCAADVPYTRFWHQPHNPLADRFNAVDATPFGRDIIAELAEACYKYGLKFGLYYSQELDWHDPDGGGYDKKGGCAGRDWFNSWDWPDIAAKDFTRCF